MGLFQEAFNKMHKREVSVIDGLPEKQTFFQKAWNTAHLLEVHDIEKEAKEKELEIQEHMKNTSDDLIAFQHKENDRLRHLLEDERTKRQNLEFEVSIKEEKEKAHKKEFEARW